MLTRRGFLASSLALAQRPRTALNFVLILVDDFGATDLGCYGSTFYQTPNLDRLAASGMRFTQGYSACTVCSPSRAAIMTGKYPARLHITDWIPGASFPWAKMKPPEWTQYMPLEERTIAEALKPLGYATASIGKWHLTKPDSDPAFFPEKQGFDLNRAGTGRGSPPSYFAPYNIATLQDGPSGEYLTDREQREASEFIRANRSRPFFLYLPHHTVHTPLQAKPEVIGKYKVVADPNAPQNNPTYAAMIEGLDENIGKLMRTLEETGVADRTVVMLTGDNGGWLPSTKTNLGLRAGKGSAYEGGVRVPLLIRWPGVTRPGSVCDVPAIGCDLYATILEMAGARREPGQIVDGVSLAPLLRGQESAFTREALYWHYPHYHQGGAKPYSAIRRGDLKLILFHEDKRTELYDLRGDPEEKKDLATSQPAKAAGLRRQLEAWLAGTDAQMPVPNPGYDPAKADLSAAQAKARGIV